jgi:hypothetical protein
MLVFPIATPLIKTVGTDMQNPGKFYWNIKSADQEQVIVKRGFDSLEEAREDLDKAIEGLAQSVGITNAALPPQE